MPQRNATPIAQLVSPSPFVLKYSKVLTSNTKGPILDVACGSGRHAFLLASLGAKVIGVDKDLRPFRELKKRLEENTSNVPRVVSYKVDLELEPWKFGESSLGAIVNVHYLLRSLFPLFCRSISPGGYFLFESVGGQGGNYLELPKAGEMATALGEFFEFDHYDERRVGPKGHDAVTVRFLGRRRTQR